MTPQFDTYALILASYALVMLSVGIISILTFDRVIRENYPRLLSVSVWSLMAALLIAALVAGGVV